MSVWLTEPEIMELPMSGAAWDAVKGAAGSAWGTAKVSDQDSMHDVKCLAGALVAVRTNDANLKEKVGTNCHGAIGTETGGRTLALGRNLAGYCAAADIVGYRDPAFVAWVKAVLGKKLDGMTLRECQENRGNNWGAMASMSRIAAAVYLGDTAELTRATTVLQGWLGDRAKYAGFKYGDLGWQADKTKPVGVNAKDTTIQGHPVDGCIPDDQRRTGGFTWPPPAGNYVRGTTGPILVALEILRRNGHPDAPTWSDNAMRRAVDFFVTQCKGTYSGDDAWIPFLAKAMYPGIGAPGGNVATMGKPFGWTGYTHAKASVEPPPPPPPPPPPGDPCAAERLKVDQAKVALAGAEKALADCEAANP